MPRRYLPAPTQPGAAPPAGKESAGSVVSSEARGRANGGVRPSRVPSKRMPGCRYFVALNENSVRVAEADLAPSDLESAVRAPLARQLVAWERAAR